MPSESNAAPMAFGEDGLSARIATAPEQLTARLDRPPMTRTLWIMAILLTFGGSPFFIAFFLRDFGPTGVFLFVAACMAVVILSVAALGPRTRRLEVEAIAH